MLLTEELWVYQEEAIRKVGAQAPYVMSEAVAHLPGRGRGLHDGVENPLIFWFQSGLNRAANSRSPTLTARNRLHHRRDNLEIGLQNVREEAHQAQVATRPSLDHVHYQRHQFRPRC